MCLPRDNLNGDMAMDCDQVFMILTRGPFPTGDASDERVEAHLETCADCWRLAEALRPAVEIFQEAVPAAESRDLPGYWGDARPATTVVAAAHPRARTMPVPRAAAEHRLCHGFRPEPLTHEISAGVLRAIALAATMTAAALTLILLFRG
jgi:hypothetical protein